MLIQTSDYLLRHILFGKTHSFDSHHSATLTFIVNSILLYLILVRLVSGLG